MATVATKKTYTRGDLIASDKAGSEETVFIVSIIAPDMWAANDRLECALDQLLGDEKITGYSLYKAV